MAESIETRRNNWMRVVWGLMNLKNGLQGWVDTKSEQQYKTFLINVNAKCKTQAYDQCQVNSKCQNGKTKVKPPFRPAHFCDEMYKEIQNNHVRNKPFWMNTDSTKWQDPQVGYWEVAKCYLSSPGYLNKTSSYQIDASGLLSICKNSMFIHQHIVNIQHFIEVQQIRNIVMHNAHCELDKHTTDAFLDKMIAVLEDPQELVHDTFAKHAANQIRNIKHNTVKVPAVNYEALNKLMLTNFEEKPCEVNELIDRLRKDLAGFIDDENKHELRHTICDDTGNDEREQTVQGDNAAVCNAEPDSDADAIHDVGLPQIWTLADIVLVLMTGYGHKWQKPKDFNDEKFLEMIDAPRFDWPCKTLEEYGLTRELEHTLLDKSGHGEREQNVKVQQREEHNKDSDKDDWGICLKNVDIEGIWELLKDEKDGTVQGRIRRQGVNDKTFALTAAHVALKEEEVTRRRTELEVYEGDRLKRFGLPVAMSTPGLQYVSVTKAALGGERHVDVALLELPKKLQLADIDWDWDDLGFTRAPSLLNGFQLWAPSFNDIVIKYGMTTGVTIGKVRGIDSSFETKETGFIEIQPWQPRKTQPGDFGTQASVPGTSRLPFSRHGDSGSLVFVVNKDIIKSPPRGGSNLNGRDLAVVGMVNMGQEGDDMFYATHIDATMAALGSEYRFDE
ncbi:uncharacterized protein LOC128222439 [Mya arenaria]|uniref:uncharacterized protein LOC128222439 n=1 Tax=Mya arenaria TaxID=6604 RepID=UPI0022E5F081|nr:uncharacterized protein LOC128222439 [Mya arenaria]